MGDTCKYRLRGDCGENFGCPIVAPMSGDDAFQSLRSLISTCTWKDSLLDG
jgi:hypothetical protein